MQLKNKDKDVTEKRTKALQTLNTDQKLKSIDDLYLKYFVTTEAKDELEISRKDRTRNQER